MYAKNIIEASSFFLIRFPSGVHSRFVPTPTNKKVTTMNKSFWFPLAAAVLSLACDPPEETDEVEFREIFPCEQYKAVLPVDDVGMKALFSKVGVITEVKVVEDKCRSVYDTTVWAANACPNASQGHWSFWYLMTQVSGTNDPSAVILSMLDTFETKPVVNGFTLAQRKGMKNLVVDPWRAKSCADEPLPCNKLKPQFAPFRLSAIVNRMDLRPDANGNILPGAYGFTPDSKDTAGEGRFVFTILDGNGTALDANIILEFALPTANKNRIAWAKEWLALKNYDWAKDPKDPLSYQARLQALTDSFVVKGAFPGRPNQGSALNTVRTNDKTFDNAILTKLWSLRQFKLGCLVMNCPLDQKFLVPTTVDLTPDVTFMQSEEVLLPFINQNELTIRQAEHIVPPEFNGVKFLGAESKSGGFAAASFWAEDLFTLFVDDANALDTRRMFGMATCSGCHYKETENEANVHIGKKLVGAPASLSKFLQGQVTTTVPDKLGKPVPFNEPQRRMCELYHTQSGAASTLTNFFGG